MIDALIGVAGLSVALGALGVPVIAPITAKNRQAMTIETIPINMQDDLLPDFFFG